MQHTWEKLKGHFRSTLPSMENESRVDSSAREGDKAPDMPTVEVIADLTEAANDALNAAANESIIAEAKASTNTTEAICEACTHISDCAAIVQKAADVIKRIALAEAAARVVLPQGLAWKISEGECSIPKPPTNLSKESSSIQLTDRHD